MKTVTQYSRMDLTPIKVEKKEPEIINTKVRDSLGVFVEAITEGYEEKVQTALQKVSSGNISILESVLSMQDENELNNRILVKKFSDTVEVMIDKVTGAVKEIKQPDINISQDKVIEEIRIMRMDFLQAMANMTLEMSKKKNWDLIISRDKNDLITTISAIQK